MALMFPKAFGATATLFTSSPAKAEDTFRLGAVAVESSVDRESFQRLTGQFDFVLDTMSAPHGLNSFLGLLKLKGAHRIVGMPSWASPVITNAMP